MVVEQITRCDKQRIVLHACITPVHHARGVFAQWSAEVVISLRRVLINGLLEANDHSAVGRKSKDSVGFAALTCF